MNGGPDSAMGVLPSGATFHDHYEVISCIKAGGMGAVYEVLDHRTRRRRALKLMIPRLVSDPDLQARFRLEATITSEIDSDHIVETFDAGVDAESGAPFIVMELLKGDDLGAILEKRGPLPASEVVVLIYQASLALDRTHAAGVVHRDLKPENLFVTSRDDGSPRLKVLDFGIAKVVAQSATTKATRSLGSPLYMSPEQISGDQGIGPHTDIYQLGHIAYTMLSGQAYWTPEAASTSGLYPFLTKVVGGARESATERAAARAIELPAGFDAWFERATARDPTERFESTLVLVEALSAVLAVPLPGPLASSLPPPLRAISDPALAPTSGEARARTPTARTPTTRTPTARTPTSGTPTSGAPTSGRTEPMGFPSATVVEAGFPLHETLADSVATSIPGLPPTGRSRTPMILACGAAGVLVIGLAILTIHPGSQAPAETKPSGSSGSSTAEIAPAPSGETRVMGAPADRGSAQQAALGPVTSVVPTSSTARVSPLTSRSAAPPVALLPRSSATEGPRPPPASSRADQRCDPPYYLDATGRKIFKRECID